MKKVLSNSLLMTMILVFTSMTIFGKGQIQKRVDFSINSPFAIRMGEYLLSPGNYILRQVLENDPNLFALYTLDLTKEPIAMIRTTRIQYQGNYPDETKLFLEMDESSPTNHPVLQAWTIPGLDGWEVIGVVEKRSGVLTKVSSGQARPSDKYKLDRTKMSCNRYEDNDKRSKIRLRRIDQ